MARKFPGGWLQAYRDYIHKQESPDIFHFWIGLTMISASLRRSIWIDRGAYTVYPNQYVILIAESASCRKSVAMEIGLDLLLANKDIRAVHEKATVEGLIDLMKKASISPTGRIKPDGSVLLHADELSNMFSKATYAADLIKFLTATYTAKARVDFLTRTKGHAQVRNPCPVVLAGTTPSDLGEIFPIALLSSGFMGRVLMVSGKKGHRIAKPHLRREMRESLIEDLHDMSFLEGEIKLTPECDEFYTKWYEEGKMGEPSTADLITFYERKHDHVLKTAMLLSVSESNSMIITIDHFKNAVKAIEYLELGMAKAMEYVGATEKSSVSELIIKILEKNMPEAMSHSVLMRRVYKRIRDADEFQSLIDTLAQSERIEITASRRGIFYKVKEVKEKKK